MHLERKMDLRKAERMPGRFQAVWFQVVWFQAVWFQVGSRPFGSQSSKAYRLFVQHIHTHTDRPSLTSSTSYANALDMWTDALAKFELTWRRHACIPIKPVVANGHARVSAQGGLIVLRVSESIKFQAGIVATTSRLVPGCVT